MISAMFKTRRLEEAKDLFATISAVGLVPSVVTYTLMITNFIKEGLLAEADDMFLAMEKAGCAPDSRLLNHVVRVLLENGAVVKAATYLAKLDAKQLSLEASTVSFIVSLFSRKGKLREHVKLLPVKYQPPEMLD
jgi:pentatricopeptide repeat protein